MPDTFTGALDRIRTLLGGDARLDDFLTDAPANAGEIATGDAFRPAGWGNLSVLFRGQQERPHIGNTGDLALEYWVVARYRVLEAPEAAHRQAMQLIENCRTILRDHRQEDGYWWGLAFGGAPMGAEVVTVGGAQVRFERAALTVTVRIREGA